MQHSKARRVNFPLHKHTWIIAGIFFLALFLRFIYFLQLKSTPLFGFFASDSYQYDAFALQVLKGNFAFKEAIYLNPLYPYILSGIYMAFGYHPEAVGLTQVFIDSLTCLFLYFICLKIFDKKSVGLLASFIYAYYGTAIFYTGFILVSTFSAFFAVSMILCLLYADEKNKLILWLLSGLLFGLSILIRPNGVLFLPFLTLWIYARKPKYLKKKTIELAPICIGETSRRD